MLNRAELYNMIFDKAPIGIIVINVKTKKPVILNEALCGMLGYSEEEFLKTEVGDYQPQGERLELLKLFDNMTVGKIFSEDNIPFLAKNGTYKFLSFSANIVRLDNEEYALCFGYDTTEKKQLRDAENKYIEEIEKINNIMVDREARMIELKKEVDNLLEELGRPVRYGYL